MYTIGPLLFQGPPMRAVLQGSRQAKENVLRMKEEEDAVISGYQADWGA